MQHSVQLPVRLLILGALAVLALLAPSPATASVSCDLVAAPGGSDAAPGTVEQPFATVQHLADAAATGQTACLRAGTYSDPSDDQIYIGTPGVTLTSYPGERATVRGRVWVEQDGDGVTIADLDLDGRNPKLLPSPTINADDVVLRGNDITNHHTTICVSLGSPHTWGRAQRTLIEDNRIHDCGALPSTNQDHGIYVNSSDDAVIRNNLIYDNADRGIQLYPDAQGTVVTGNVIDGNGEGVIFGGSEDTASSNNVVENNVITNSNIRDNIDASWGGVHGTGNVARNNCVGGGAYDEGDGGILTDYPGGLGFSAVDNVIRVPAYANPDAGDFTIPADDPCAALLDGAAAEAVAPTAPTTSEVTITTDRSRVRRNRPVRVSGSAPGAGAVIVVVRRNGGWRRIGSKSPRGAAGSYSLRVRLPSAGRRTLKAVATGLRDSRPLRLRVRKT